MTLAIFRSERNGPVQKEYKRSHLIVEKCHFSVVLKCLQECCLDQIICENKEKIL